MFHAPLIMMNDEGTAIYTKANPTSVSSVVSPRSIECRIRVIENLLDKMPGTSFEPHMHILLNRLYTISRDAFAMKHVELGRRGVKVLSRHGFRDHPGPRRHRIACRLVGLEAKERFLAGRLHSVRSKLRGIIPRSSTATQGE